jgi:AGZA family xanthine/uracil permease-like MFS transporter
MAQDGGSAGGGGDADTANESGLARYFGFAEHATDLRTEVLAGVTTFLTMSYIVVVNPAVMTAIPGEDGKPGIAIQGYTPGEVQQMLAVVTILAAAVAIFVMAFYANRPFGQAPGLGLNAFFAFTVVGALGIPWQTALAAVVTEGVLFMFLTAVGAREYVIELFPEPVKYAVGTGIGLFLAIIGLEAMGVVVDDPATLVTLGAVAADPVAIVAVFGFFLTAVLYARGLKGSIVIGVLLTTLVGYLATVAGLAEPGVLFPRRCRAPSTTSRRSSGPFSRASGASTPLHSRSSSLRSSSSTSSTPRAPWSASAGGFLDEEGNMPHIGRPLMADAIGTTVGGILGTSTVTTYIESATGVEEGGRTGMTALVIGLCFLAALVVVPLAAAIPLYC